MELGAFATLTTLGGRRSWSRLPRSSIDFCSRCQITTWMIGTHQEVIHRILIPSSQWKQYRCSSLSFPLYGWIDRNPRNRFLPALPLLVNAFLQIPFFGVGKEGEATFAAPFFRKSGTRMPPPSPISADLMLSELRFLFFLAYVSLPSSPRSETS